MFQILIFTAFITAALGLTSSQIANAKDVHFDNKGLGANVINENDSNYKPRGYIYVPTYYRGRGYHQGPKSACARGFYGLMRCARF